MRLSWFVFVVGLVWMGLALAGTVAYVTVMSQQTVERMRQCSCECSSRGRAWHALWYGTRLGQAGVQCVRCGREVR